MTPTNPMDPTGPETVISRYVVKPGHEAEFEALLARHWPTLRRADLVTSDPPQIYKGAPGRKPDSDSKLARTYVEIFQWTNAESVGAAHETAEVLAIWEPMGALCESVDFPHFRSITLS